MIPDLERVAEPRGHRLRLDPSDVERMARALTSSLGIDPDEQVVISATDVDAVDGAFEDCPFTGEPQRWRRAWRLRVRHVLAMFDAAPGASPGSVVARAPLDRAMAAHRETLDVVMRSMTMTHREMAEAAMAAALTAASPFGDDLGPGLLQALRLAEARSIPGAPTPEKALEVGDRIRRALLDRGVLVSPREGDH